ncbi:MAG: rod shape-determining protein RodA [Acetatifactor sp.]|nr:rod shape-determining protein RodA [Acetatifactor sp.]
MFTRFKLKDYDFRLIIPVILLSVIGVMVIGSAQESLKSKQLYGVIAGIALMLIISFVNYSFVLKFQWLIYGLNLLLLAMVFFGGESSHGAQRWLVIGGIQFQPSETAKILLILFFAQFIMKYKDKINTIPVLLMYGVFAVIPWALIALQPDLSTSIVIVVVLCLMLFAGGISYKIVFAAFAVAVPAVIVVVSLALNPDSDILRSYQKERILAFINPEEYALDEAYQQLNSVTAIASGQLDGKGYKNNEITSVKNGRYYSEAQTDFIFAVIGEEFGFKGSLIVIVLLFWIALECIMVAIKAKDVAGCVIATGVGGLIAFQGFFNIGVATFILPNTGLPLPFVSYGLTSLLSLYMCIGFVLNVRLQPKKTTKFS